MEKNVSEKGFDFLNYLIMILVIIVTLYPFLYVAAVSFSSEGAIINSKVSVFPVGFNVNAYKMVIEYPGFWSGYYNTIIQAVLGTSISMFMMILCAYPLSRKNLFGSKTVLKLMTFTMFFSGGIIPNYLLVNTLGLYNTLGAIVLPGAVSVWNMLILRTFFKGLPPELEEAAQIDGLNPPGVLLKVVLPLSKTILATIGLFTFVYFWNSWFPSLIYLSANDKFPVTLFLRNIINGSQIADLNPNITASELVNKPTESLKSAAIILVAVPVLIAYPFVQKYFVQGMMVGSIKE